MRPWTALAMVVALPGLSCDHGAAPRADPGRASRPGSDAMKVAVAPAARRRASPGRAAPPPARRAHVQDPFAVDPKLDLKLRWDSHRRRRWLHVSYLGSAGDRVPALFRRARGRGRLPAVILGHGHGGDARSMVKFFGEPFKGRRVHLLAVNHPFHGHSRQVRGQDICAPSAPLLVRRFTRAVRDLRHAVRLLQRMPGVDPRRIGYLGFSLGAVLGGLLIAHEPRVRAAVLVSPAGDWPTLARSSSYWKLGWNTRLLPRWLADPAVGRLLATVDPARVIARFAPRPLLLVVGSHDRVIHPSSGRSLARAAGRGSVLLQHRGGHGPGRRIRRRAARWLVRRLEGRP